MVKKRTIVGGAIVGGLAIGMLLGGKIPGFGNGAGLTREAEGTAAAERAEPSEPNAAAKPEVSTPAVAQADEKPAEPAAKPEKKEPPKPPEVIDVMVEESNYSVSRGGVGNYRDLKLSQIITLAKMTTGNDDGLRVRIYRKPSAKYLAYATLQHELEAAGLDAESIRMPYDLAE